jgi:hypothetical protein
MGKLYYITTRKRNLVNCAAQLISNRQRVVFICTGCFLLRFVAAAPSKPEIPPRASIVLGLYCRLWKLIHTPPQPRFLHGRGMQSAVDDPKLQRIRHVVIDSLARSTSGLPNNQTILEGRFTRPLLGGHGCKSHSTNSRRSSASVSALEDTRGPCPSHCSLFRLSSIVTSNATILFATVDGPIRCTKTTPSRRLVRWK